MPWGQLPEGTEDLAGRLQGAEEGGPQIQGPGGSHVGKARRADDADIHGPVMGTNLGGGMACKATTMADGRAQKEKENVPVDRGWGRGALLHRHGLKLAGAVKQPEEVT